MSSIFMIVSFGTLISLERRAVSRLLIMEKPAKATLRPRFWAVSRTSWMRAIWLEKLEMMMRPFLKLSMTFPMLSLTSNSL